MDVLLIVGMAVFFCIVVSGVMVAATAMGGHADETLREQQTATKRDDSEDAQRRASMSTVR